VTNDLVPVTARITDAGKGIGRIEWRVNGITVAVVAGPAGRGPRRRARRQRTRPLDNATISSRVRQEHDRSCGLNAKNLLASVAASTTRRRCPYALAPSSVDADPIPCHGA
jgi:hypothetical protein